MPCDYSKYPPDWKQTRQRILERDGNKCKFCGVPNHIWVTRNKDGKWFELGPMEAETASLVDSEKVIYIVLTIAHLHQGPKDCPDDQLAALCQKCHLGYDRRLHASNAAQTRRLRKEQIGQVSLLEEA